MSSAQSVQSELIAFTAPNSHVQRSAVSGFCLTLYVRDLLLEVQQRSLPLRLWIRKRVHCVGRRGYTWAPFRTVIWCADAELCFCHAGPTKYVRCKTWRPRGARSSGCSGSKAVASAWYIWHATNLSSAKHPLVKWARRTLPPKCLPLKLAYYKHMAVSGRVGAYPAASVY